MEKVDAHSCFFATALFLFLISVAVGPISYADTIVAPNGDAGVSGGLKQYIVFGAGPTVMFQWDIASSQLTSLVGQSINAIGFRAATGQVGTSAGVGIFDLELSRSLNPIGFLDGNPAANIAPGGQTVYAGSVNLSTVVTGGNPNPFFLVDFTTPYFYTGGDLLFTETVGQAGYNGFAVDAVAVNSTIDTASNSGGQYTAQFYNAPVTELVATPVSSTPEPASLALLGTGMAGMVGLLRKRIAID